MANLKTLFLFFCSAIATNTIAQINYAQPADIIGDGYKIVISGIESEKDNTLFEVTFFNTSRNEYLTVDPLKIGVDYTGLGTYYYNSKFASISNQNFVVAPGDKKSKNIKVVGDFDHKQESIKIIIDGLKKGPMPDASIAMEPFKLSSGFSGKLEKDDFYLEFSKVSVSKNGLVAKAELEFPAANEFNYLIDFSKALVTATNANGDPITIDVSTNNDLPIDSDTDKNITFKVAEEINEIIINWGAAFKKIDITQVVIEPTTVTDVKVKKQEAKVAETKETPTGEVPTFKVCDPISVNSRNGNIALKIVSDAGCFKVYTEGELINSEFTSSLTFNTNAGYFPAKIVMETGEVIEKKLAIGENYTLAYYNLTEKKGEYSIKLSLGSSQGTMPTAALTETTFAADEITCKDQIFVDIDNWTYIKNVTVVGITKTHVRYVSCENTSVVKEISKNSILQVEYANKTYDTFDYDGGPKQGLDIVRSRQDTYERHTPGAKPGQSTSSFVIGPNK